MAGPGQNNDATYYATEGELRQFVERIETLNSEKADIAEATKEVFAEAKGHGYDTKALRQLIAIRKQDAVARSEQNAILRLYGATLGIDVFG